MGNCKDCIIRYIKIDFRNKIYVIIKTTLNERGVMPMREILLIFISSLILPLLKDFLIEVWKDKRNKDKNKKQD